MANSPAVTVRPRAPTRAPALVTLLAAVVACFIAVAIGGAALPGVASLGDPGAVVRWGLPIIQVVHDLAAALTIGLLVVGALFLPGRGHPGVMLRAARIAVATGVVWVIAGLVDVVFEFSDAAGTKVTSAQFWPQFTAFAWSLETIRVGIISTAIAAVAVGIAVASIDRGWLAFAAFVGVAALLPLALNGHASGSSDHEVAVNALGVHLVSAALWVGGLVALLVLRPLLTSSLPAVVQRYSAMAGWCYAAVALSGIVSGVVRLGGLDHLANLTTPYGVLLLVKAACLVVLGLLGWQQRRRVVTRMGDPRTATSAKALLAQLAVIETLVMAVAFGFAAALARTPTPDTDQPPATPVEQLTGFPAPAEPTAETWFTLWRFDWLWGVVAIIAVGVYISWVVRLRRRGDRWGVLPTVCWVLGWAVMVWATCGAPGVLGRVAFSWHMVMHMTVAMYVPLFLVLGRPTTLALRAMSPRGDGSLGPRELLLAMVQSRWFAVLANPVVAGALFFVSLAVFYYSPLFELALTTHTGHALMVSHFLLTGYLFVWSLIGTDPGPPKWSPPLRLLVLLVTISFHAFFGVALMTGTTPLAADFFGQLGISWIPDIVAEQQRGGGIAWGIGEGPTLILALLVVRDWVRTDAAETKRTDRKADRDGGADLAAYNERLRALAERDKAAASPDDRSGS